MRPGSKGTVEDVLRVRTEITSLHQIGYGRRYNRLVSVACRQSLSEAYHRHAESHCIAAGMSQLWTMHAMVPTSLIEHVLSRRRSRGGTCAPRGTAYTAAAAAWCCPSATASPASRWTPPWCGRSHSGERETHAARAGCHLSTCVRFRTLWGVLRGHSSMPEV